MPIRPLTCRGLAETRESLVERIGNWIPVLGWLVGNTAYDLRMRPFVKQVRSQLRGRPVIPVDVWGSDAHRVHFALWLCKTINQEALWPNDHFCPDDPVRCLCVSIGDPLAGVDVVLNIEDEIGSKLSDADVETIHNMTLGQAVDFLLARATDSGS